jgi:hypothetical protein
MYRKVDKCIHEKVVMYSFTVSGYVMARLTKVLEAQFAEGNQLQKFILKKISQLNYGK